MCCVSVVIPIYNSEKYLKDCIESVLCQSYENFELILVNDGSKDSSEDICKEYAQKDKRVKYYYKENEGVAIARNFGIDRCVSPYIMFIDSDDSIMPDTIKSLVSGIKDADFSMCGYEIFDDINNKQLYNYNCPFFCGSIKDFSNAIEHYLTPPFLLGPCFKMFKTSIIRDNKIEFPAELSYGEDAIFVLNYLMVVNSIYCNEFVGYRYRRHGNKTLSTSFREDKIDINMQINKLVFDLLSKYDVTTKKDLYLQRTIEVFVSYTRELMLSKMPYREKMRLFYEKAEAYSVSKSSAVRNSQKIVMLAVNHKILFFVLYVFKVK